MKKSCSTCHYARIPINMYPCDKCHENLIMDKGILTYFERPPIPWEELQDPIIEADNETN